MRSASSVGVTAIVERDCWECSEPSWSRTQVSGTRWSRAVGEGGPPPTANATAPQDRIAPYACAGLHLSDPDPHPAACGPQRAAHGPARFLASRPPAVGRRGGQVDLGFEIAVDHLPLGSPQELVGEPELDPAHLVQAGHPDPGTAPACARPGSG